MDISEQELNIIRGKILSLKATDHEVIQFMSYVSKLEELIEEASNYDFYGTEGWKHLIGWD